MDRPLTWNEARERGNAWFESAARDYGRRRLEDAVLWYLARHLNVPLRSWAEAMVHVWHRAIPAKIDEVLKLHDAHCAQGMAVYRRAVEKVGLAKANGMTPEQTVEAVNA